MVVNTKLYLSDPCKLAWILTKRLQSSMFVLLEGNCSYIYNGIAIMFDNNCAYRYIHNANIWSKCALCPFIMIRYSPPVPCGNNYSLITARLCGLKCNVATKDILVGAAVNYHWSDIVFHRIKCCEVDYTTEIIRSMFCCIFTNNYISHP